MSDDTVKLLKSCDKGSKMAVNSIDELMDKTKNNDLLHMLIECKDRHSKIGNEIHEILNSYGKHDEEIPPVAKAMSWVVTNMKMMAEHDDKTIADIMTDGCNMGIKSLNKDLNTFVNANQQAKSICNKIIKIEENFADSMREYL